MPQKRGARRSAPVVVGELQTFKAQFFRALAHPTRIRILEILVRGGRTVQELQDELALGQPIVSQQLAVLRNQGIVSAQKEGLSVRYALRDPLVGALLDVARRIFDNRLGISRDCCVSCGGASSGVDGASSRRRQQTRTQ
jgi:ArsR family transcriptional regulator